MRFPEKQLVKEQFRNKQVKAFDAGIDAFCERLPTNQQRLMSPHFRAAGLA